MASFRSIGKVESSARSLAVSLDDYTFPNWPLLHANAFSFFNWYPQEEVEEKEKEEGEEKDEDSKSASAASSRSYRKPAFVALLCPVASEKRGNRYKTEDRCDDVGDDV